MAESLVFSETCNSTCPVSAALIRTLTVSRWLRPSYSVQLPNKNAKKKQAKNKRGIAQAFVHGIISYFQ